jgi:hypothetical protein
MHDGRLISPKICLRLWIFPVRRKLKPSLVCAKTAPKEKMALRRSNSHQHDQERGIAINQFSCEEARVYNPNDSGKAQRESWLRCQTLREHTAKATKTMETDTCQM